MAIKSPMATSVFAIDANEPEESPLGAAVRRFNQESSSHHIGMHQLPLTEEEVIAAIHCWDPPHKRNDEARATYSELAESRTFPLGARIYSRETYDCNKHVITVWWIYLNLKIGQGREYAFRIRDQKIDSREYTDDELARKIGGPSFKGPK